MTLRDDLLPTVFDARGIAGELGFRTHSVAVVVASTPGLYPGDGPREETVTTLAEGSGQPPRVRWLKDDERALGALPVGTVEIGPITPQFVGGGTDLSLLTGANMEPGELRLIRITGPNHPSGADYTIQSVHAERALRYMLTAIPVGSQES